MQRSEGAPTPPGSPAPRLRTPPDRPAAGVDARGPAGVPDPLSGPPDAWPGVSSSLREARGNPWRTLVAFLHVVIEPRAYARALYLFLAFPLGCLYILVLAVGAFAGASMLIVLVGVVLCVVTLILAYIFAALDRELVIHLLGIPVPPLSIPEPTEVSAPRRLLHHLRRRNTWTGIVYLCLVGPFGAVAWTMGAILIALPIVATIADVRSAVGAFVLPGLFGADFHLLLVVPLFAVFVAGLHVADVMGRGWGQFAATMLSNSAEEARAAQAENRAAVAERDRRELILNVSHELRTPIASIQGHLDTLLLAGAVTEDVHTWRPYVQTAASETRRLGHLVDELLMVARADADTLRVEVETVRLQPLIEGVVAALAPLAQRERDVTLVCPQAREDYWALADPGRLTQVLSNLARNAIVHTPPGGAVALGAALRGPERVELTVADTGVGLRPEELGRIFERFYRTDSARGRDSGGFGLGLAIARDLVEAMGGTITATSEVGIGTTLRVLLRRAAPGAGPSPDAVA